MSTAPVCYSAGGMPPISPPVRIQLSRAKGWRMPPDTVKVDRTTFWGNPFPVAFGRTQLEAANLFRSWLMFGFQTGGSPEKREAVLRELPSLRGKNLACWCRPGEPCHADVLLEMANA